MIRVETAAIFVICVLLFGCGGGSSAPDTDAPDTDAPDTDAPDTDAPDADENPLTTEQIEQRLVGQALVRRLYSQGCGDTPTVTLTQIETFFFNSSNFIVLEEVIADGAELIGSPEEVIFINGLQTADNVTIDGYGDVFVAQLGGENWKIGDIDSEIDVGSASINCILGTSNRVRANNINAGDIGAENSFSAIRVFSSSDDGGGDFTLYGKSDGGNEIFAGNFELDKDSSLALGDNVIATHALVPDSAAPSCFIGISVSVSFTGITDEGSEYVISADDGDIRRAPNCVGLGPDDVI